MYCSAKNQKVSVIQLCKFPCRFFQYFNIQLCHWSHIFRLKYRANHSNSKSEYWSSFFREHISIIIYPCDNSSANHDIFSDYQQEMPSIPPRDGKTTSWPQSLIQCLQQQFPSINSSLVDRLVHNLASQRYRPILSQSSRSREHFYTKSSLQNSLSSLIDGGI